MKTLTKTLLCAAMALGAASASAEASYGYQSSGAGAVTATARVGLSVQVAKLILLRVGSTNSTVDTLSWTATVGTGAGLTAPLTSGGASTNAPWTGAAPTITPSADPAALDVFAWTNASGSTLTCSTGAGWNNPGGPAFTDFTVTTGGSAPNHPGANLGCGATANLTANNLYAGTWAYALGGTPANWLAGTYTATVTYTASAL
jgi:hypothetical protein